MATLDQLRSGLKARLATISGLRAYATMPPKPEAPAAAVLPRSWRYHDTFDDKMRWEFEVHIYVSPGQDLNRAQTAFDAYISPTGTNSVKAAIEADPTLGGIADYVMVIGGEAYASLVDFGGAQLLGGFVRVEVLA